MNSVAFRTLYLVLGAPASSIVHDDIQAVVTYHWPCGCTALCADGYKCTDLQWCEQHRELLWFPERAAEDEPGGATVP